MILLRRARRRELLRLSSRERPLREGPHGGLPPPSPPPTSHLGTPPPDHRDDTGAPLQDPDPRVTKPESSQEHPGGEDLAPFRLLPPHASSCLLAPPSRLLPPSLSQSLPPIPSSSLLPAPSPPPSALVVLPVRCSAEGHRNKSLLIRLPSRCLKQLLPLTFPTLPAEAMIYASTCMRAARG